MYLRKNYNIEDQLLKVLSESKKNYYDRYDFEMHGNISVIKKKYNFLILNRKISIIINFIIISELNA